MTPLYGLDAYAPREVAARVIDVGVGKTHLPWLSTWLLGMLAWLAGHGTLNDGAVGRTVVAMAQAKADLPWPQAFARGVLCNVLVCMAVWMAMAGRSVVDKAVAVVWPVTAFVAAGFEHSIAS